MTMFRHEADVAFLRLKASTQSPEIVAAMARAMSLYAKSTGRTDYPPYIFGHIKGLIEGGATPEDAVASAQAPEVSQEQDAVNARLKELNLKPHVLEGDKTWSLWLYKGNSQLSAPGYMSFERVGKKWEVTQALIDESVQGKGVATMMAYQWHLAHPGETLYHRENQQNPYVTPAGHAWAEHLPPEWNVLEFKPETSLSKQLGELGVPFDRFRGDDTLLTDTDTQTVIDRVKANKDREIKAVMLSKEGKVVIQFWFGKSETVISGSKDKKH